MNAEKFVRDAWATTDQEARKQFVRAHVGKVSLPELEKVVLREMDKAGWNVGILMVAQRILQIVPSQKIMHGLLAMEAKGAAPTPNGPTLHKQLRANLEHLASRHPALADAEKSFRATLRGSKVKVVAKSAKSIAKPEKAPKVAKAKAAAKPAAKKSAAAKPAKKSAAAKRR